MKKYELTSTKIELVDGTVLYQIRACKTFFCQSMKIKKGELGGWIKSEKNLSQEGSCWVSENSQLRDNVVVKDNALITSTEPMENDAIISGNAIVEDTAAVRNFAKVTDDAFITANALVCDHAIITDRAVVYGTVFGSARITGKSIIYGTVSENAYIRGRGKEYLSIPRNCTISGNTIIDGDATIENCSICVSSDKNLLGNYFSAGIVKALLSNINISDIKDITITPVNFAGCNNEYYLTKASANICLASTSNSISIKEISYSKLLTNIFSQKENDIIEENYTDFAPFLKSLESFMLKNETFYIDWADHFVSQIKMHHLFDGYYKNKINDNENRIKSFARQYVFSQFLGIALWMVNPVAEDRWLNFLENLMNYCTMDFLDKTMHELDKGIFVWNEEMISMVGNVCGFSKAWQDYLCEVFKDSKFSLKLYC